MPTDKQIMHSVGKFISIQKIKRMLLEEKHCPLMIYDLLKRDHEIFFHECAINKKRFRKFIIDNFEWNKESYLKQQNFFKLQYKFPKETTEDTLKEKQKLMCQLGQKKVIEIRKSNPDGFSPHQKLQFWLNKGLAHDDACVALKKFKQENSPFSVEFYLKRGYSHEQSLEKTKELHSLGASYALKRTQNPQTEQIIDKILKDFSNIEIEYVRQFSITLNNNERLFRKTRYIYDFCIFAYSLVIECHGTYWHCDPRFFKASDNVKFPGNRTILAEEVWERDDHRKAVAHSRGYKYLVFWEHDLQDITYVEKKLLPVFLN